MKNFIIGIGGTGAKCLEHLIHCCTAGLGPEDLWIGMVDQDEANGNVNRTKILLNKYQNLRNSLRDQNKNDLTDNSNLFKTNIITNPDPVWLPMKDTDPTLEQLIKYNMLKPEVKGLIDCLYEPSERTLELSKGFRGRPNIGAAAMLSTTADENDTFWSQIYKAIDAARGGEEVRVFIISSIFGGTGASGFPNIARRIKTIQKEKNVTSNFHLGGALMLPYFNYQVPDEGVEEELFARPEEFLDQTKGALDYYSKLFEHNKIFDQVYITGWNPLSKLSHFEMGGNLQDNPPLFPELYAALGALRFFSDETNISENQEIFHIGKNESDEILWSDIPKVSNNLNSKDKLTQLIRFTFTYNWLYGPALTGSWSKIKKYSNENWFKRLIYNYTYSDDSKSCEIGHEKNQEIILSMKEYCEDILTWITDMQHSTVLKTEQKMNLIISDFFSEHQPNNKNRVKIKEKLNSSDKKQFKEFISETDNLSLLKVMSNICYINTKKEQKGLGAFMDVLFRSCEK